MQRLVFDTSTLVGAVIRPKSIPRMAYELAVHKGILLLGAATWAKADAVITSDDDLLSMKLWRGIDILTPAQWVVRAMAL